MKYVKRYLDQRANRYIIGQLDSGKSISEALLRRIRPTDGSVFAFLPESYEDFLAYRFGTSQLSDESAVVPLVVEFIQTYLADNPDSMAIGEEVVLQRGDKWVDAKKSNVLYEESHIYYFVGPQDDPKVIESFVSLDVGGNWLRVIFLTEMSTSRLPEDRGEVTREVLQEVALHTKVVIMGAYDFDSYLVWELEGSHGD